MKKSSLLIPFICSACGYDPIPATEYVASEDMQFVIVAKDSGNDANLSIRINSPAGFLELSKGDIITARIDDNLTPLTFVSGAFPSYRADVAAINNDISIDFERSEGRGFRDLRVTMPPDFTATTEAPIGTGPLVISWTPAPPDPTAPTVAMSVTIKGDCIPLFGRDFPSDSGMETIEQSDLQLTSGNGCPLEVELTRRSNATGRLFGMQFNANFSATLDRYRAMTVNLNP